MIVLVTVEAVVLVVLVVLVAGLLRAYATVLERLHRLDAGGASAAFQVAPGTPAPLPTPDGRDEWADAHDLVGTTPRGEILALRAVGVEHDTILLFLSSGCVTCQAFWDELAAPDAPLLASGARLLVVTRGSEAESPDAIAALANPGIEVIMSTQAWSDYAVPGSPYVVLVDGRTGRVRGEGTGQSWTQVAELLARSSGDASYLTGGPFSDKPAGDQARESDVDRELMAAGILPGDPRLYGEATS